MTLQRYLENTNVYDQVRAISEREADEIIAVGTTLRDQVLSWLKEKHPELLSYSRESLVVGYRLVDCHRLLRGPLPTELLHALVALVDQGQTLRGVLQQADEGVRQSVGRSRIEQKPRVTDDLGDAGTVRRDDDSAT